MAQLIILAIFVLTLAIISAGILISSHLRATYQTNFLSTMLFYLVFWFTFGFYVFWGQILLTLLLGPYVEQEILDKIINITVYLGSPFLIFAGLMIVKFMHEISGRQMKAIFISLYMVINVAIFTAVAFVLNKLKIIEAQNLVKYVFILDSFLFTFLNLYYLNSSVKKRVVLKKTEMKFISFCLILMLSAQTIAILFYNKNIYYSLIFILIYFLSGLFLPIYLRYTADLSTLLVVDGNNLSFENFCNNFEISKREKEIIIEIYNGLSNQQIADKLFISLQTVKDHTHRIYIKTNCNSRTQLIRLLGDNF